jgi:hypothetical protein
VFDALPAPNPESLSISSLREERLNNRGLPESRFSRHEHYLARASKGRV